MIARTGSANRRAMPYTVSPRATTTLFVPRAATALFVPRAATARLGDALFAASACPTGGGRYALPRGAAQDASTAAASNSTRQIDGRTPQLCLMRTSTGSSIES